MAESLDWPDHELEQKRKITRQAALNGSRGGESISTHPAVKVK
jgi:hypothetical protein